MMDVAIMSRPVQISLDEQLLKRIDADPEARERGRSAFIRSAVQLYLRAKQRRGIDDAIRRAYWDKADEMLSEIEDIMLGQTWPEP